MEILPDCLPVAFICHTVVLQNVDGPVNLPQGIVQILLLEVGHIDGQTLCRHDLRNPPAHDTSSHNQYPVLTEILFHTAHSFPNSLLKIYYQTGRCALRNLLTVLDNL